MRESNDQIHVHLHIHEGASPEAARAAAQELRVDNAIFETADGSTDPNRTADYVRRSYVDSKHRARPLLELLADNPDRLIPYAEITEALNLDSSRSLPGLLGAFSRRADHRYNGFQPFERHWDGSCWNLLMPAENAAIINSLR